MRLRRAPATRPGDEQDRPASPRRRTAIWIASSLAIVLALLVVVLAQSAPATTRAVQSPLLGKQEPAARGTTIDGDTFDLNDYLGKWVLVNFFATWCVPCRKEHPDLIQWQQRHEVAGDATIVGVIFDDSVSAVRSFRKANGGDWPMLIDPDGQIAVDFGVAGVPESYLISPEGIVVSKIIGGIRDSQLEELFGRARAARR